MSTSKNVYSIERKGAAESLKVSLRTLDRYIGSSILSARRYGRRILLCEKEIHELQKRKEQFQGISLQKPHGEPKEAFQDRIIQRSEKAQSQESVGTLTNESRGVPTRKTGGISGQESKEAPPSEKIFQKLYLDLLLEMKAQQKRLEGANYRVGQLEAQLKNTVPLLDYHAESLKLKQKEAEFLFEKEKLTREAAQAAADREKVTRETHVNIRKLQNTLFTEKINKWAYIIVLFLVLIAQPILWFLLNK